MSVGACEQAGVAPLEPGERGALMAAVPAGRFGDRAGTGYRLWGARRMLGWAHDS